MKARKGPREAGETWNITLEKTKNEEVKEIIEEKIYMGEEENDMMLPDLISGALRILEERYKARELDRGMKVGAKNKQKEIIIKILTKKFNTNPNNEIIL